MEKLEVIGPWSGTEGGSADPKSEMGHWSVRVKAAGEEREKLKEAEMEVVVRRHKKRMRKFKA